MQKPNQIDRELFFLKNFMFFISTLTKTKQTFKTIPSDLKKSICLKITKWRLSTADL